MRRTRWFGQVGLGILVLALAASFANACLWDRDTLRTEAAGIPGTVDVIIGWFDRWPAEVYEMRLERVASELESDPTRLDLYDDAAVASDRVGKHDEAIEWMRLKREQLDALPNTEHEYRYHANLGTMLAHRWFANGANRAEIEELREGATHIEKALESNPDAHFGRERLQLRLMQWIIEAPVHMDPWFDGFVPLRSDGQVAFWDNPGSFMSADAAVEGLTGLVVLGNAWESVDVFTAIMSALNSLEHASIAYLAQLRVDELLESGKNSANSRVRMTIDEDEFKEGNFGLGARDGVEIKKYFEKARASAEVRNERRRDFILNRLAEGRHPDLESEESFWNGWVEPASVALPNGVNGVSHFQAGVDRVSRIVTAVVILIASVAIFIFFVIIRFLVRWLNSSQAA